MSPQHTQAPHSSTAFPAAPSSGITPTSVALTDSARQTATTTSPSPLKITVADAADEACVDATQIGRWVNAGRFRAWNVSETDNPGRRAIRIDATEFREFLESRVI